jgi:beta-glucosidase/6-phospho-beta-glucosidase/beta-galactosidase
MFMGGVVDGRLDENWDQGPGKPAVRSDLANRCDFIGVNYYFRFEAQNLVVPALAPLSPFLTFNITRAFDENRPRSIYAVLKSVQDRYKKPLYVSETGTTQDDEPRGAAWVVDTLSEVRHAIRDGVDVRGYFAWSLMDNYEWNHGMGMRFGLLRRRSHDEGAGDPRVRSRLCRDREGARRARGPRGEVRVGLSVNFP